ncbi:MAG: hypothetical protein HC778_01060 [Chamaesiphon sp. CSU_1_12]|nr:hypothetical protein [Chamaesiphon sp. CSU_1_12]
MRTSFPLDYREKAIGLIHTSFDRSHYGDRSRRNSRDSVNLTLCHWLSPLFSC